MLNDLPSLKYLSSRIPNSFGNCQLDFRLVDIRLVKAHATVVTIRATCRMNPSSWEAGPRITDFKKTNRSVALGVGSSHSPLQSESFLHVNKEQPRMFTRLYVYVHYGLRQVCTTTNKSRDTSYMGYPWINVTQLSITTHCKFQRRSFLPLVLLSSSSRAYSPRSAG